MPPVDFVKKKTKIPSSAKDPLLEFFLEKTFKPPRGDHDERLGFEFSARFG
jgi:hypothetical protein